MRFPPAKLRRPPTSEQVTARLWQMIFAGEIRTGDRIPQDDLASELGVSRIPVREALVSMAQDGMIVNKPHIGSFLAEFSPAVIRDHFEIYGLLQSMAAIRLVRDGNGEALAEIDRIAAVLSATDDPHEVNDLSTQLARAINVGSGSSRLRAVLRALGRMFPAGLYPYLPASVVAQKRAAALIGGALAAGDEGAIRAACLQAGSLRAEALLDALAAEEVFPRGEVDKVYRS